MGGACFWDTHTHSIRQITTPFFCMCKDFDFQKKSFIKILQSTLTKNLRFVERKRELTHLLIARIFAANFVFPTILWSVPASESPQQ
jgi:hypothetical protein